MIKCCRFQLDSLVIGQICSLVRLLDRSFNPKSVKCICLFYFCSPPNHLIDFSKRRDISCTKRRVATPAGKARKGRPRRLAEEARSRPRKASTRSVVLIPTFSFGEDPVLGIRNILNDLYSF
jgi:hypothetical protein